MSASRKGRRTKEQKQLYNREYQLQTRFGMTAAQYDALLQAQNERCAVCNEAETVTRFDRKSQRLAVDHCHTSGRVRGLICQRCNRTLGLCRDNPNLLRSLANYLERPATTFIAGTSALKGDLLLKEFL